MSAATQQAARFADGLERTLWTAAEAAGATGLLAGYQALPLPDIADGYLPLALIVLAAVLAGVKSSIAQKWGNGTAATLPAELEPVPASEVAEVELLPDVAHADHLLSPAARQVDLTPPDPRDLDGDGHDDETGRFTRKP